MPRAHSIAPMNAYRFHPYTVPRARPENYRSFRLLKANDAKPFLEHRQRSHIRTRPLDMKRVDRLDRSMKSRLCF
jgi:hypothetical protein